MLLGDSTLLSHKCTWVRDPYYTSDMWPESSNADKQHSFPLPFTRLSSSFRPSHSALHAAKSHWNQLGYLRSAPSFPSLADKCPNKHSFSSFRQLKTHLMTIIIWFSFSCFAAALLNKRIAQNPLDTFPRNFPVDGEVANLLRACYGKLVYR